MSSSPCIHRQHDDAGVRLRVPDRADGVQAVHARQLQVHQRDVGPMLQELLDRLFAVARLRDDGHVGLQADDADDAFAHQTMVVDAEYANRRPRHAGDRSAAGGADSGATATTAVPWPGWLEIRTWPPIFSARSFMFIRPRCAPGAGRMARRHEACAVVGHTQATGRPRRSRARPQSAWRRPWRTALLTASWPMRSNSSSVSAEQRRGCPLHLDGDGELRAFGGLGPSPPSREAPRRDPGDRAGSSAAP